MCPGSRCAFLSFWTSVLVCLCVHLISCDCFQRAEPRHHHRGGGRGGDHHPGVHGVRLHHREKVRSRGPHWLSAPVSLRLSISLSVTHGPPRLWRRHNAHTHAPIISSHAVLMDCDTSFPTSALPSPTPPTKLLSFSCRAIMRHLPEAWAPHSCMQDAEAGWSVAHITKHPAIVITAIASHTSSVVFVCMRGFSSQLGFKSGFSKRKIKTETYLMLIEDKDPVYFYFLFL